MGKAEAEDFQGNEQPKSLIELVDFMIEYLPEPPEPARPAWLPMGAHLVMPSFDTEISHNGAVSFGSEYETRETAAGRLGIIYARNRSQSRSTVLITAPHTAGQDGHRVWFKGGEGEITKTHEALVADPDFYPSYSRKLNLVEVSGLVSVLYCQEPDETELEHYVLPSTDEQAMLANDRANLSVLEENFVRDMARIRDAEWQAYLDSRNVYFG